MKNNIKISALVVAHNEENKLSDCLKNLVYADELVVILDKTNDRSDIIAKKYGARIYKGSWDIEANRRNFGIKKCKGDVRYLLNIMKMSKTNGGDKIKIKEAKKIIAFMERDNFFETKEMYKALINFYQYGFA